MITALVCMYRLPRREIGRADKRDQAIQGSESCGLELEGHISELASMCVNRHNKIMKKKSVYKDSRQLQHLPRTGCHPHADRAKPPKRVSWVWFVKNIPGQGRPSCRSRAADCRSACNLECDPWKRKGAHGSMAPGLAAKEGARYGAVALCGTGDTQARRALY